MHTAEAPDRRLLFVLQRASRAALCQVNALLDERVGISLQQLATLSHVHARPGCSMTDVADVLDLNKSAVTTMCARLERAGLVRREPNPRDGRGALLFPTEKGTRLRERSKPVFRALTSELTEGFSIREVDVVLRFLNALVSRYKDCEQS